MAADRAGTADRAASAVPADERRRLGAVIEMELRAVIATVPGILGVYWPFRAEFDPRALVTGRSVPGVRSIASRDRQERPARIPRLASRRDACRRRLEHPNPGKAADRRAGARARAARRLRSRLLSARLWRRLFRPDAGEPAPQPRAIGVGFEFQSLETIHPQSSTCRWMRRH